MRPGHMKWDYAHTFGQLKPDVIVSIWEGTSQEAAPYLKDYVYANVGGGVKVYLRKGSPDILWDKVTIHKLTRRPVLCDSSTALINFITRMPSSSGQAGCAWPCATATK